MCHAIFDHLIRAWQCKESKIYVDQYIFYESTWPWAKMIIEGMLPDSKIIYIKEFQRINFEKVYFCSNSFGGPGDTFAKTGMLGLILKHPACLANKPFLKELRRLTKKLTKNCNQQAEERQKSQQGQTNNNPDPYPDPNADRHPNPHTHTRTHAHTTVDGAYY